MSEIRKLTSEEIKTSLKDIISFTKGQKNFVQNNPIQQ